MRVLILSLDQTLVSKSGESDTLNRLTFYKKSCQSLFVIVPTNKKSRPFKKKGINIFPVFGKNNLSLYWQIYQGAKFICKKENINLIVTNDAILGALGIWLKRQFPIKVQIGIFGLEINNKRWILERPQNIISKLIQEWAIKRTDGLRTDSYRERNLLIKYFGCPEDKIVVTPVAPSLQNQKRFIKTKPDKKWKRTMIGSSEQLILSVGGLQKAKDYSTLVSAAVLVAKKHPQVKFIIVGEGSERKSIEKKIRKYHMTDLIKLLGSVDYRKLPKIFASADLLVLSSTHEGFPRVLMEAALAGTPIVSTAIHGAEELIESGKTGLIVPIKKPKLLADAILSMLSNKETAIQYGKNAKVKARILLDFRVCAEAVIRSWQSLLRSIN